MPEIWKNCNPLKEMVKNNIKLNKLHKKATKNPKYLNEAADTS